jgi:hypothetical protein
MRITESGTAGLGRIERTFYALIALAALGVMVWVGLLLTWHGDRHGTHTDTQGTAWERPEGAQDRDLLIQGGYLSWQATDACARGPEECERMLTAINVEAASYGLVVFEDGSISPRELVEPESGGTLSR